MAETWCYDFFSFCQPDISHLERKRRLDGLSDDEKRALKACRDRQMQGVAELRGELEAPFANLPPLPPPLPAHWEVPANQMTQANKDFYALCQNGSPAAVIAYIEDQNPEQEMLQGGLLRAVQCDQPETAKALLANGSTIDDEAVQAACKNASISMFSAFLEFGWHPNQQLPVDLTFQGGPTPLLRCIENINATQFLLRHGADPNLGLYLPRWRIEMWDLPGDAVSPQSDAIRHMRVALTPYPPLDRHSGAVLEAAAQFSSPEIIDILLQHGAKLEYAAPLHAAATHAEQKGTEWPNRRNNMERFLDLGVDIDGVIEDTRGKIVVYGDPRTPLKCAVNSGDWDLVEFLLEKGADPSKFEPDPRQNQMPRFQAVVDKVRGKQEGLGRY